MRHVQTVSAPLGVDPDRVKDRGHQVLDRDAVLGPGPIAVAMLLVEIVLSLGGLEPPPGFPSRMRIPAGTEIALPQADDAVEADLLVGDGLAHMQERLSPGGRWRIRQRLGRRLGRGGLAVVPGRRLRLAAARPYHIAIAVDEHELALAQRFQRLLQRPHAVLALEHEMAAPVSLGLV